MTISNIKQGYNRLDFDVTLVGEGTEAELVLPRIWYKGYVADYSSGADGSQPEIVYAPLSEEELLQYQEAHKPDVSTKALNDGRATITINKGGHVTIRYRKTTIQWIGFVFEFISWTSVLCYSMFIFVKNKKDTL